MVGAMKHNTPTRSHKVENSEQEKTRILLVADDTRLDAVPGIKEERLYRRLQFHLVDLESDTIHLYYTPSLLQYSVVTSAVAIDNSVYIFGCRRFTPASEIESENQKLDQLRSLHHDTVFIGASRYDLTSDQSQMHVWSPAPVPTKNLCNPPVLVKLGHKIYGFGTIYLEPEVLDPTDGKSKSLDLPPELVGCKVSRYAFPDPSLPRILLHLSDGPLPSPSIYEFRPSNDSSGGKWKPIAADFQDWTNVAAVVDNAIYFYEPSFPDFVRAFDLASGTWLKIHWESEFERIRRMGRNTYFVAMIPLGNRILCFASLQIIPEAINCSSAKVELFKFRVEQSGETVTLFPVQTYSYVLPDTQLVRKFLPV